MRTTIRRLTAACAALTLAAVTVIAQERGDADKVGIKVHGHWTIDVRKADGTLVSHNDFENALTGSGGTGLGMVLSRTLTMGGWGVLLDGGVCQGPLTPLCVIQEASAPQPPNADWDNNDLVVLVPPPGQTNGGLLVMKGSVRAAVAGQITAVRTRLSTCVTTQGFVTEPQCAADSRMVLASNVFDVTSRTLTTPIPVDAGQFIQVTVVLSFS
jgi:hypothetical protein